MACHGTDFTGYMSWPYLDMGALGTEKTIEGFDLAVDGEVTISVGYNQRNFSDATDNYLIDGDTLDGVGMIPYPVTAPSFQFRLTFSADQLWEWQALNVYLDDEGNA